MGSYWSYYELGWGGWWFWDPVENASFMPWLAGTALLHSALVMEKREALKIWTDPARHPDLLAVAARHLPRALRRAHLGPCLRHRSAARRLHPGDPRALHRRRLRALRLARADPQAGRPLRADLARGRARAQQPLPDDGGGDRARRHALPAGARGADRGEDLGRPALLQPDLRPADRAALLRRALRAAPRLEARRSLGRRRSGSISPSARASSSALGIVFLTTGAPVLAALGIGLGVYVMLGALVDLASRAGLGRVAAGTALAAPARPAPLGLRHDARPFRARRLSDRHRRGDGLLHRDDHHHEDRRRPRRRRLSCPLRRHATRRPAAATAPISATSRFSATAAAWSRPSIRPSASISPASSRRRRPASAPSASASSTCRSATRKRAAAASCGSGGSPGSSSSGSAPSIMAAGGALSLSDRRLRIGAPRPQAEARENRPRARGMMSGRRLDLPARGIGEKGRARDAAPGRRLVDRPARRSSGACACRGMAA